MVKNNGTIYKKMILSIPAFVPLRVNKRQVRAAVDHAKLLCTDYERSKECRLAWVYADEMMDAYSRQFEKKEKELERFDPREEREYDV